LLVFPRPHTRCFQFFDEAVSLLATNQWSGGLQAAEMIALARLVAGLKPPLHSSWPRSCRPEAGGPAGLETGVTGRRRQPRAIRQGRSPKDQTFGDAICERS